MYTSGTIAGVALSLVVATAAPAATMTTIDFTDIDVWSSGASTETLFPGLGVAETTVSAASMGGPITTTPFARSNSFGPLVSTGEGLGVNDDEVTNPGESITISFSGAGVDVLGFHFGKLFTTPDGSSAETAIATFDNGASFTFTSTTPFVAGTSGYGFFALPSAIRATSVTFTAGEPNDGFGMPDFSLAGIDVQAVPLPASVMMLAAGLLGLSVLTGRRRA